MSETLSPAQRAGRPRKLVRRKLIETSRCIEWPRWRLLELECGHADITDRSGKIFPRTEYRHCNACARAALVRAQSRRAVA